MGKLKEVENAPTKIRILGDVDGAWEEMGFFLWNGKTWETEGDMIAKLGKQLSTQGMIYKDKRLYGKDRNFYLALLASTYISFAFEAVE